MYNSHFGLEANPFSIAPDPHYLYMSEHHNEALAHLTYGIQEGNGFVLLTGEVGTGKTTLCRSLLNNLPDNIEVALILNPRLTANELLATLCDELHIEYPEHPSLKILIDGLNHYLLQAHSEGKKIVLMVDEAQSLNMDVLEQIRLLTNLETQQQKLLQIILIGQPELREFLNQKTLRQISQRITARYHLTALTHKETAAYIQHRLRVSGARHPIFKPSAMRQVYLLTYGIPRLINVLCDRALLGAYVNHQTQVNRQIVKKAATEVLPQVQQVRKWRNLVAILVLILLIGCFAVIIKFKPWHYDINQTPTIAPHIVPQEISPPIELPAKRPPIPQAKTQNILSQATLPQALHTLFHAWSLTDQADTLATACQLAASQQLGCWQSTGNWQKIKILDHPVLLILKHHHQPYYLTITQIRDNHMADANQMETTLSQIDPYWLGDFLIFWRQPNIQHTLLKTGMNHPDVSWLRQQLSAILETETSTATLFDDALQQQVLLFQQQQGLIQDGIAGQQTLLRISLSHSNHPSLQPMAIP